MSIEPDQNELLPGERRQDGIDKKFEALLKRMKAQAEQAHRERLAFMATQPQSKPCKVHPDCIRPIDEKATDEATRYYSFSLGKPVAGYAPCPKCVQDAANNELKKFGVPDILIHATFENYTPDSEVEAGHVELVKAFCAKRTGFLPLLGGYGTGKTHLAVAALRSFGSGWIVKQASLLRALRDTDSDKAAFGLIYRAQSARMLVLDDVGLSAGGRDELPMLHEILDYRHGERLPTIITSNLPFEKLTPVLGERMADRLRESAFRVLTFTGTSHRRDARARYFDAPPVEPPRPAKIHESVL